MIFKFKEFTVFANIHIKQYGEGKLTFIKTKI